ncbi:MAG TPA: His/Gly/Thr/Pro-type tRNA ligase C-terminal domain-containing protein [Chitinophagaceae bacterium]|nr:His/Gly/Thr/Pro-type tRNA ligase C-terminal domain-containing protein [Chitinophagaceae bacterium]
MKVLPISDKFSPYAHEVAALLKASDIRASVDDRNEKIGKKIRDTELMKVPYMLVVGEQEMNNGQVAVRKHGEGDKGVMANNEFVTFLSEMVKTQMSGTKK